jgi:hypothetical protein
MVNSILVFVFYCMMAYIGFIVLWALYGAIKAIFVPSSRTYSRHSTRRYDSNGDEFNVIYWDDSSHCNHSSHDHCDMPDHHSD